MSEMFKKIVEESDKDKEEGGGEIQKKRTKKPKKDAAQHTSNDDNDSSKNGNESAVKQAKESELAAVGMSRKRQRPKLALAEEEMADPVVEALRRQLKHISKVFLLFFFSFFFCVFFPILHFF